MTMKLALRRRKVLELLAQGYSQVEIAEKLGVHRNTVGRDIKAIGEQLTKDLQRDGSRAIVRFLASFDAAFRRLIKLYDEAETVNEKRLILKDIREAAEQRVRILQSLGLIAKAPEKIEHMGEVKAKHEFDLFEKIEEYAEVFRKLAGRSDAQSDTEGDSA
ncbi:helix-turn-helix domain-containing protein [Candidatus Pyrohabitans sp.]